MKQQSLRQKFDCSLQHYYEKLKKKVKKECKKQNKEFNLKKFKDFVKSSIFTFKKLEDDFGYVGIIYNYKTKEFISEVSILHDEDKKNINDKIAFEIVISRLAKRLVNYCGEYSLFVDINNDYLYKDKRNLFNNVTFKYVYDKYL